MKQAEPQIRDNLEIHLMDKVEEQVAAKVWDKTYEVTWEHIWGQGRGPISLSEVLLNLI